MTGVGTIDLGTKQMGFRVEPKLVMTTEGQGRTADPVGFGIPVIIDGPWAQPRIYPGDAAASWKIRMQAYGKLKEMGKGLFGPGGLAALGGLLGGGQPDSPGGSAAKGQAGSRARSMASAASAGDLLGGQLGETLGNLLQQGLSGFGQASGPAAPRSPQPQHPGASRTEQRRAARAGRAASRRDASRAAAGQPGR